MKYISVFLFSIFLLNGDPKPNNEAFVIIQLFTSQGCSSCPPADRLVELIKEEYKDQNVYVMSYHVDYWDRLGWKDPFSKRAFTELQYDYAQQFQERRVYTPQIVVNGKEHFVGSDSYKLRKKITSYLNETSSNTINIDQKKEGNDVNLSFQVSGKTQGKTLKIAYLLENHVTHVKRGENSNRTLSNSNVVLQEKELVLDSEGRTSLKISLKDFEGKKVSLISYVQTEQLAITGVAEISL